MLRIRTITLCILALLLALSFGGGSSVVEAGYRSVGIASTISGLCSEAAEHVPGNPVHHCRTVDSAALAGKLRQRSRHVLAPSFKRQRLVPLSLPLGKTIAPLRSHDRLLCSRHDGAPFFAMLARTTRILN